MDTLAKSASVGSVQRKVICPLPASPESSDTSAGGVTSSGLTETGIHGGVATLRPALPVASTDVRENIYSSPFVNPVIRQSVCPFERKSLLPVADRLSLHGRNQSLSGLSNSALLVRPRQSHSSSYSRRWNRVGVLEIIVFFATCGKQREKQEQENIPSRPFPTLWQFL